MNKLYSEPIIIEDMDKRSVLYVDMDGWVIEIIARHGINCSTWISLISFLHLFKVIYSTEQGVFSPWECGDSPQEFVNRKY